MAINQKLINKINKYAKLKKERMLTDVERKEQSELRKLYLDQFKSNLKNTLNDVSIVDKLIIKDKTENELIQLFVNDNSILQIKKINKSQYELTYDTKLTTEKKILKKINN